MKSFVKGNGHVIFGKTKSQCNLLAVRAFSLCAKWPSGTWRAKDLGSVWRLCSSAFQKEREGVPLVSGNRLRAPVEHEDSTKGCRILTSVRSVRHT